MPRKSSGAAAASSSAKKKQPWRSTVPASDDEREEEPMQQEEEEEEEAEAFEVHKIIGRRLIGSGGSGKKLSKKALQERQQEEAAAAAANFPNDAYEYRIWWKGYPEREATWEPFSCLDACPGALREFLAERKHKRAATTEETEEQPSEKPAKGAAAAAPSPPKIRASVTLKSNAADKAHDSDDVDLTAEDGQSAPRTATGAPSASKRRNVIPPAQQRKDIAAASTPVPAVPSGVRPTTFTSVIADPPQHPHPASPPPARAHNVSTVSESVVTAPSAALKRDQVERKSQVRVSSEAASTNSSKRQQQSDTKGDHMEIDSGEDEATSAAVVSSSTHRPRRSAGDAAVQRIRTTARGVTMLSSQGAQDFAIRDSVDAEEIERMFAQADTRATAASSAASSSHSTPAKPHAVDEPEEKSAKRPRTAITPHAGGVVIELGDSSEDEAAAPSSFAAKNRSHRSRGIRRRRSSPALSESEQLVDIDGQRPRRIAAQQAGLLAKLSKDMDANVGDIRALFSQKVDPSLAQKVPHRAGEHASEEQEERKTQSSVRKPQTEWEKRKARKLRQENDAAAAASSSSPTSRSHSKSQGPFFARHTKSQSPQHDTLLDELAEIEPVGVDYIASMKRNPDFGRARALKALRESVNIYQVRWDDGSETWEPESILHAVPDARRDFIKRQAITQWRRDHPGEYELGGEEELAGREEFEFISRAEKEFEYESEEEEKKSTGGGALAEDEIDSRLYATLSSMVTPHDRERIASEHQARDSIRRRREREKRRAEKKKEEKRKKEEEAKQAATAAGAVPAIPIAVSAAVKPAAPKPKRAYKRKRLPAVEVKSAATLAGDAVRAQNAALAQQYSAMYLHMQKSNLIGPDGVPLIAMPAAPPLFALPASPTDAEAAADLPTAIGTAIPTLVSPMHPPVQTTFYPVMPQPGSAAHQPMLTPLEFEAALAKAQMEAESLARARELAEEEYLLHEGDDQWDVDEEFQSDGAWHHTPSGGGRKSVSAAKTVRRPGQPRGPRRTTWNKLDTPGLRALNKLSRYQLKKLSEAKHAGEPMPKVKRKRYDSSLELLEIVAAEWDTEKMTTALLRGKPAVAAAPAAQKSFEVTPEPNPYLAAAYAAAAARNSVQPTAAAADAPAATATATSPPKPVTPARPSTAFMTSVFGEPAAATIVPVGAAARVSATVTPSPYQHPAFLTASPTSMLYNTPITPLARPAGFTVPSPSSSAAAAAASQRLNPEAMMDRALARMQAAISPPNPASATTPPAASSPAEAGAAGVASNQQQQFV